MATAQDGFTPLHFCSQAGCADGCRLLLEAGAKADAKLNKNRKTALHLAAVKGHAEVVRVLVEAGASTSLQNSKGETPLDVAASPDVRVALAGGPQNNPAGEQPVAATATPSPSTARPESAPEAQAARGGGNGHSRGIDRQAESQSRVQRGGERFTESGRGDNTAAGATGGDESEETGRSGIAAGNSSIGAEKGAVSGVAGSRTAPDKSDGGGVGEGTAQEKEEFNKVGGTGGGGNVVEKIGSLAERRRKKRKLAKIAAAVGKGISLSHLERDGEEDEVVF